MLPQLGKVLVIIGLGVAVLGCLLIFSDRLPLLGRLPGDLLYRKGNFTLYIPIVTMLILSIVLTILLNILRR